MQEGDFDKMREETFSESFVLGVARREWLPPGLQALRCPVESSHVLAMMEKLACGWVSRGLPRTHLFPSPYDVQSCSA